MTDPIQFILSSAPLPQPLAAAASPWLETLGRFHVTVVHFPIALLLIAGLIEGWRAWRGYKEPSRTAIGCLLLGGLAAVLSSVLGWIHKGFTSFAAEGSSTLALHQWIGIA